MENSNFQCRICLADGEIPIYADEEESLSDEISIIAGIQLCETDAFPKHMCESCFHLLLGAIVFRNAAKNSDDFLRSNLICKRYIQPESSNCSDIQSERDQRENDIVSLISGTLDSNYLYCNIGVNCNTETNSELETQSSIRALTIDDNESVKDTQSNIETQSLKDTQSIYESQQSLMDIQSCTDTQSLIETESGSHSYIGNSLETMSIGDRNENESLIDDGENKIQSYLDKSVSGQSQEFTCDLCNLEFNTSKDYHTHVKSNQHIKMVKKLSQVNCHICNKLVSEENYENHFQTHNNIETELLNMLECTSCNIQYSKMEDFEEHCNSAGHKNSLKKLSQKVKCTVCDKYITKSYLKMHVKLHANKEEKQELLRQCPYCDKSMVEFYLSSHIQRNHKDKSLETKKNCISEYICDQCGKVFKKKYNLKLHILTHGAEMNYKCMFCPYRAIHAGLLKIHVLTHTKDYNYKCSKCPAKFLTKCNLMKHEVRHTGSKDYQCDLCDKSYYTKSALSQHHEAVHSGVKNHICNICGKAFSSRNYMMCHQLKVHKRTRLKEGKGRCANYLLKELSSGKSEDH